MQRIPETKTAWRSRLLSARRAREAQVCFAAAEALRDRLLATGWVTPGATVAGYESLPAEPGTSPLRAALQVLDCRVLLPVARPDRALAWRVDGTTEVHPPEALRDASLVVVPALAVDSHGVRLGRGAGCYDRALRHAAPGAQVVALLYDEEYVDELPREPHDVRIPVVVTPERVVHTGM